MRLSSFYVEFTDYLKAEKNASPLTVHSYTKDFEQFLSFLKAKGIDSKIPSITTPIIRRFIATLKTDKNYSTRNIRRRIHSLSSYFKFLMEQEYIDKNPMLSIHAPKKPETLPKFLSAEEIRLLLKMPESCSPENALRNLCILKCFLLTGMRRSELLKLDWDNINFGENSISILGKGNKQRIVPMPEKLSKDLWRYLQSRLPLTNDAVFISSNGNRLSPTPLEQTFRLYIEKLGWKKKGYTIHTLRHTFASHLALNGASILSIQKLLGHADLNSTEIYAHVTTSHLLSEVEKLNSIIC